VYSREIDGQTLNLSPSGWAYKNTFVLYDKESGTLWYPTWRGLKGIQGKYNGRILKDVDSKDTNWGKWLSKNPNSKILQ